MRRASNRTTGPGSRWVAVAVALAVLPASATPAGLRRELLDLTGGRRVKIVWQQDTTPRGLNVSGAAKVFTLRGYDTDTDRVFDIRADLDDYSKPMITHDGRRVVYTDRLDTVVWVIDWDGSNRRAIADGSHGAIWLDAATGKEWVYYQHRLDGGNHEAPIRRLNLDDPSEDMLVWNRTRTQTEYIGISADGTRIGGCFPYNKCGMIQPDYRGEGGGAIYYSAGDPPYYSDGCWATITPDNSYRVAIFRGSHNEWAVWDHSAAPGAGPDRVLYLGGAPEAEGREMYQPRMSNHPSFFTISGPYVGGVARGKRTRTRVEVYFGRLDPGLSEVTGWARITRNARADYYPYAWVAPEPGERPQAPANARPAGRGHRPTEP